MKFLKLFLKIVFVTVLVLVIFVIVLLNAESYKIVTKSQGNKSVNVEVKKFFGKKISESLINSSGFYHGHSIGWGILSNTITNETEFKNGYWHGQSKTYNRNGHLTMIREWDMGTLIKVFLPEGSGLKEVPKEKWPEYVNIKQQRPQRINE